MIVRPGGLIVRKGRRGNFVRWLREVTALGPAARWRMQGSEGGEFTAPGRFVLLLALSQGCASLALGYFRSVAPGRGGVVARLRGGTGWRWRDQLNVHAIALIFESSGRGTPCRA